MNWVSLKFCWMDNWSLQNMHHNTFCNELCLCVWPGLRGIQRLGDKKSLPFSHLNLRGNQISGTSLIYGPLLPWVSPTVLCFSSSLPEPLLKLPHLKTISCPKQTDQHIRSLSVCPECLCADIHCVLDDVPLGSVTLPPNITAQDASEVSLTFHLQQGG